MRPNTLLKTLEKLDAFRRPDRFEQFLIACEADFRGRLGLQDRPYPQAGLLRNALKTARDVDLSSQIAAGLQGEALARALREMRLKAIKSL